MDDLELRDTIDWVAIRRLQNAYADSVNRLDWDAVAALFTDDAVVRLSRGPGRDPHVVNGASALCQLIESALTKFDFFQFVVLNAHIELRAGGDPDVATARVTFTELRRSIETGERDDVVCLYEDDYQRLDGGWRFAARSFRPLGRMTQGFEVYPSPTS